MSEKQTKVPVYDDTVWHIVGRRHVSESYLSVVRYVLSRLKGKRRAFLKWEKYRRRYVIAAAIGTHAENRHVYHCVMGNGRGEFEHRYFWNADSRRVSIRPQADKPGPVLAAAAAEV